ncbi:MAG: arylesterase, partial [Spirosomataceae bacterium]
SVVNAGLSGETTAGGLGRLDWVLNQKVDIFILELGANDGLRGIPLSDTRANLQAMIDMVWKKNPDTKIVLAGMQIPPNMGQTYTNEFKNIWKNLADKNNIKLIPFLLDGVGGVPALNQADGIHPTAAGHKILANNVWEVLKEII